MFIFKSANRTILLVCALLIFATACASSATEVSVEDAVALTVAAGQAAPTEISVEESVALTVAASNVESPEISVDEAVALTVAASGAGSTDLSVEESVALTVAASGSAKATPVTASDGAAPTAQPIQVTADPNLGSSVPQLKVNVSSANVRGGPGTAYPSVGVLVQDSVVPVIAKTANDNWYIIRLSDTKLGWIANSVTDPVGDFATVSVAATIPAPPTATPTNTPTATATSTQTATPAATTAGATSTPAATTTGATATPAVTLSSPTAVPASIWVVNNSSFDVCFILTADSGGSYGDNLISGQILGPGNSVRVSHPKAGPYDLAVESCDGSVYWDFYNQFNDTEFTLTD